MTTDLAAEPVAVWDCGQPEWWHDREAKTAWLKAHGLPALMYRAEFHDDPPRAVIYCYARNSEGRRHFTHPPGECTPEAHGPQCVAREEPRTVLLSELPPAELR